MPPLIAGLLVFGTSAAVLALEILAVRLLAPHLGITLEVTTGVIGTILAGIATGTWVGGRLADRIEPRRVLGPILIVGGVLSIAVIPMVNVAAASGVGPSPLGVLVYAGTAFFLPAAVLSATSPTVVKMQLHHLGRTGSIVGGYSAIGTAGAIAGSFVTGFVLVAALPTRPIIIAIGAGLIAAGLLGAWRIGRTGPRGSLALGLLMAGGAVLWAVLSANQCQRESAYYCIDVQPVSADGTERVLWMDTLRHSYVDLDDPTRLEFMYTRLLGDVADAMAPPSAPVSVLHVGGGGFTLPRYVASTRPGSTNRVLELDPVVVEVARGDLGLEPEDGLSIVVGDARLRLADEPDGAYDLVIGDAFGGPAVPWHLTTVEFISEIRRTLRPDGIYAVNVIDHPPLDLARAELATLASVFAFAGVYGPASRVQGTSGGNVILLASDSALPEGAILGANRQRGGRDRLAHDRADVAAFTDGATILRDDFAPTDQLLTR